MAYAWSAGRRWAIGSMAVVQGLLCMAALGLMLTGGYPLMTHASGQGNGAAPSNPFADLHGWAQAGAQARALAARIRSQISARVSAVNEVPVGFNGEQTATKAASLR